MPETRLQRWKLKTAPWLFRGLAATLRIRSNSSPHHPDGPVIFACLHRDMIPAILFVRSAEPVLLVSNSEDGEILSRTLGPMGYRFVRGSSGEDGSTAFRGLVSRLAAGEHVGIAVDGPRGPFGHIHEGVLRLAQRTGAPIVPLVVEPGAHLALRTWDRTVVPAPFSSLHVRNGSIIHVGPGAGERRAAGELLRRGLLGEAVS